MGFEESREIPRNVRQSRSMKNSAVAQSSFAVPKKRDSARPGGREATLLPDPPFSAASKKRPRLL